MKCQVNKSAPESSCADEQPTAKKVRKPLIETLSVVRSDAGLPQTEVAKRMDMCQPSISNIEARPTETKISTLLRYCDAVGAELAVTIRTKSGRVYSLVKRS